MQQLDTWFNSPRGHATVVAVLVVASQIWPQYAAVLNRAAVALGYGARAIDTGRDAGRATRREHSGVMGAEMPQPGVQEADGEPRLLGTQRADDPPHRGVVSGRAGRREAFSCRLVRAEAWHGGRALVHAPQERLCFIWAEE